MNELLNVIVTAVKRNAKKPQFYIAIVGIIVAFAFLFPYIDTNFFYFSRINNRILALKNISEIDINAIKNSDILMNEYKSILSDISNYHTWMITSQSYSINENQYGNIAVIKFITGGMLCWLLAICAPFMTSFKSKKDKVVAFVIMIIIGLLLAQLSCITPVIISPMINYIGIPILQIVVVVALVIYSNRKKLKQKKQRSSE